MKKMTYAFLAIAMAITMGFSINYSRVIKSISLTSLQASNILTMVFKYRKILSDLERRENELIFSAVQMIQNNDKANHQIKEFQEIETQRASNILEFKKRLKVILSEKQYQKLSFLLKSRKKPGLIDNLDLLYKTTRVYLGFEKPSTDTEIFLRVMVLQGVSIREAIDIMNLVFEKVQNLKSLDSSIESAGKDYQEALKAGVAVSSSKDRLLSLQRQRDNLVENLKASMKDILGNKYAKILKYYEQQYSYCSIERIIFDGDFINALQDSEKSA